MWPSEVSWRSIKTLLWHIAAVIGRSNVSGSRKAWRHLGRLQGMTFQVCQAKKEQKGKSRHKKKNQQRHRRIQRTGTRQRTIQRTRTRTEAEPVVSAIPEHGQAASVIPWASQRPLRVRGASLSQTEGCSEAQVTLSSLAHGHFLFNSPSADSPQSSPPPKTV